MASEGRRERLAVFARYPEAGKAKTRLIPALGPEGAAELHAEMVRRTIESADAFARARPGLETSVWHTGGRERFEAFLGPGRDYREQAVGDLGERMLDAFRSLTEGSASVVLIGTDCPGLTSMTLREAFDALEDADMVLGPASDGGYYLIALHRPIEDLLEGMAWGTSEVLEETLARAARHSLRVRLLEVLDDVDEPRDLPAWHRATTKDAVFGAPWLSVIVPTLHEEDRIAATVRAVLRPGVEVLVADGGSRDETVRRALDAGARVIKAPRGRGTQMNAGAAAARGGAYLFLHADTSLPDDYMDIVRRELTEDEHVLGAFRFRIDLPGVGYRLVEWGVRLRCALFRMPYGDQALFLSASTFQALGGYPAVPIMEDVALVRRARAAGSVRVVEAPATTSGRRWATAGLLRVTLVNVGCSLGELLGISPERLVWWRERRTHAAPPQDGSGHQQRNERDIHLGRNGNQGDAEPSEHTVRPGVCRTR